MFIGKDFPDAPPAEAREPGLRPAAWSVSREP